jgi:hypothetical protein
LRLSNGVCVHLRRSHLMGLLSVLLSGQLGA